jgi:uncharacterized membrane protein
MKTHLRKIWDSLRSSYWFIPLVMMVLAVALWWGTSSLDNVFSSREKKAVTGLYIGNAEDMRTLLLTIAAAIIGIVGVVFSIIMVPLSIAASQFGPRLLRTFLRDTGTQVTLGTFMATFIFCMIVLLQLSNNNNTREALPQISVNMALLLGLSSFGVLIFFISHVAVSIQAPIVVARVSKELHAAIRHNLPDTFTPAATSPEGAMELPGLLSPHSVVTAAASGYLQVRDDDALLHLAQQHNFVMQLLFEPGDFIIQGKPLVNIWPSMAVEPIEQSIRTAFVSGVQRTLVQDITFGINELVEVAVRALSPAINDPFTAMTCLDWIGSALCQLCTHVFPSPLLYDHDKHLRIISKPVSFTQLCDAAFHQIREYGRTSRAVTIRLADTLKAVAQCAVTPEQYKALLYHVQLVERNCHIGLPEDADRQAVMNNLEVVKEILNKPSIHSIT